MEDADREFAEDLFHLARLALSGKPQDVQLYVRRMLKRYRAKHPELAAKLEATLRESPVRSSPLRRQEQSAPIPVDLDSRLHLVRFEKRPVIDVEPVFSREISELIQQLVTERRQRQRLDVLGLKPTRTALFVGEPGVGKTLAAKWIARELGVPLLTLDLAAVMSSFLGRTGNNVRYVLDYAKSIECVLLLDELDAIAKRRDDGAEVGELKRLVTVLLQEIDEWPADGLLLGATNHPDLLDPAVWRRFELLVEFPKPSNDALRVAIERFLGDSAETLPTWSKVLAIAFRGASFSDIERGVTGARRLAAIHEVNPKAALTRLVQSRVESLSKDDRVALAAELVREEVISQREAYELTGISRDTIRKAMREGAERVS